MNAIPLKRCSKCGKDFPATTDYFPRRSDAKDGLRGHCHECVKSRRRDYYVAHREEAITYSVQWNKDHPELRTAYGHRWYTRNVERVQKYNRQWWQEHPEKSAEYSRQHYAANPEQARAKRRLWYRSNKAKENASWRHWARANHGKVLANGRRRRARKYGAEGSHNAADIKRQYDSQHGVCWWCSKPVGRTYHVDHLIPLSRGGSDAPNNLVITCRWCNLSKRDKLPQEWCGRLF